MAPSACAARSPSWALAFSCAASSFALALLLAFRARPRAPHGSASGSPWRRRILDGSARPRCRSDGCCRANRAPAAVPGRATHSRPSGACSAGDIGQPAIKSAPPGLPPPPARRAAARRASGSRERCRLLLRLARFPGRGHQKGTARIAEHFDHLADFHLRRASGEGAQIAQAGRAPDATLVCRLVGERLEQLFADLLQPLGAQLRIGLLGVLIERSSHRADGLVMPQLQRSMVATSSCQRAQVRLRACCRIDS